MCCHLGFFVYFFFLNNLFYTNVVYHFKRVGLPITGLFLH